MKFRQMYVAVALATVALCSALVSAAAAGPDIYVGDFQKITKTTDLGATSGTHVAGAGVIEGLEFDLGAGKMYWTSRSGPKAIRRSDLDGSNVESLLTGSNAGTAPRGLALDGLGKMYWGTKTDIRSADLNGSNKVQFLGGTGTVRRLRIVDDLLYFAAAGNVSVINLDGTGETHVLEQVGINGFDIDTAAGKIYYANSGDLIQKADLDGTNIETVLDLNGSGDGGFSILDLRLFDGKIYYTDNSPVGPDTVSRVNLDGSGNVILMAGSPIHIAATSLAVIVPEPSTLVLVFVGLACMTWRRRRGS